MKILVSILCLYISLAVTAQAPEDVLKFSRFPQQSTARIRAVGGAVASAGGDITSVFVNPAGLGFYKTNDAVFTAGFGNANNKTNYRDSLQKNSNSIFNLGPSGLIFAHPENKYQQTGFAFSIAFTQQASFKNRISFSGLNNLSSFSEQFAEEFSGSGYSINDVLNTNSPLPYTSAPALNTFLIDTVRINGAIRVRGAAENILDANQAVSQSFDRITKGGAYELAFGAAANNNKNLLIGASIGIPIIYYENTTTLTEKDTSTNNKNGFASARYTDSYTSSGAGFNLRLGAIYRPAQYVRLGLAVHTPSLISITETRSSSITTALESPMGNPENYTETSNTFTNGQDGKNNYNQQTPWRVIGSASYVFREIQNTKKQRGFVTADVEYVNYASGRFRSNTDPAPAVQTAYYKELKDVIKQEYKGTVNVKAGTELKFNTIMLRQGFAFYGNPYKDSNLKASAFLYTGGIGYRNKGFFVDLAYELNTSKEKVLPYRLADRPNTFASVNSQLINIGFTVGVKL